MKAFITGTDTGVGKTTISVALLEAARLRGLTCVGVKPIETGCEPGREPSDAEALWVAAGGSGPVPSWLCRYRYTRPASPEAAHRHAPGHPPPSLEQVARDWAEHSAAHEVALCEGAGGLLVPLGPQTMTPALVRALELPVLVVARWGLGTINHTLLTLESARHHGLDVMGFVLNGYRDDAERDFAEENAADIERHGEIRCLGVIPWLGDQRVQDERRQVGGRLLATLQALASKRRLDRST